ncbi:hypothetical protein WAI453_000873 [Rhynchosporium graminicola]|uniref:PH domain-containing protein n=1 Tax=Rhynchosporium graminicola TaxID=2792576 RepID=A0A1E1K4Y5_9HELO|nr:uncharacterized protein RCO7_07813 [Rhynchosporium commune]
MNVVVKGASSHGAADFENDDGTTATNQISTVPTNRHSMDGFFGQEEVRHSDDPPAYDTLPDLSTIRRKFNIQPREDEGREVLPPYSSAISIQSVFLMKMELEGAVHQATDRNWYRVVVTLQGTALNLHKFKGSALFGAKDDGGKPNDSLASKRGPFLRSYNLQHADVGIAADYLKKRFVIRVRAEADQFLLSCNKIETFVLWLQTLFAAIDLAPPLDDREIPRDLSIPRRIRRRNRAGFGTVQLNANLVREQEEIISSQFPQLSRPDSAEDAGHGALSTVPLDNETIAEETESSSTPPSMMTPSPSQSMASLAIPTPISRAASTSRPTILSRARHAIQTTAHLNLTPTVPNPSITPDGKWRPQHQWTHFYDMLYAKRCMAILTQRSPRKSNLVIMMGKQWVVDWATGKLERCQPPDYGELEYKDTIGELRSGQSGNLTRI